MSERNGMDEFENMKNGVGALAELTLLFYQAAEEAGADYDTCFAITSIFMNTIMALGDEDE